ncbi:CopG family transcriptional regulator [Ligilactobacillus sp. Marseille-Q7487]|uniref:ribbon-helix-helix domain-containing protein n=1 Tax=Ligilactobacillus sp. Marseille-Q7487 TaxID=3022128 RepID=UPI0024A84449|nr:CopG family transcriptional regulator [Ligilactobacillus sp. Marseille-Q7487]
MATTKKRLTISLSDSVLSDLEKLAKEKGLSKSGVITLFIEKYKAEKGQIMA